MQNRRLILENCAHAMRHAPTFTEELLFNALRAARLGVSFRRQVVIDRFVVDLVAPTARLIVEVDGLYHSRRTGADARRDRRLARLGYRVLRLSEELVRERLEDAVARIRAALAEPP